MKSHDLFRVCLQNLFRRKTRTFLTVMGVVLGCCSVMIMISMGIGMKLAQEQMLSMMGDLTVIQVFAAGKGNRSKKITPKTMDAIKGIPGVLAATPRLSAEQIPITVYGGKDRRYRCVYWSAAGIKADAAEQMGYRLIDGEWNTSGQNKVLAGEQLAFLFEDQKRPSGRNMREMGTEPYFDLLKTPLILEAGEEGKKMVWEVKVSGRMKEDFSKGMETSEGLLFRIEDLQRMIDEYQRAQGKAVKQKKEWEMALVKAESIQQVAKTEEAIRKLGLSTSSMESIRKPMEQEARQKQMMFGCLGAVSLFVAALGITNTMIMSISERTKEIGVMKALGCQVRDVRTLFLLEAGTIGFIGGVLGMLVSYGLSAAMNIAASAGLTGGLMGGEELEFLGEAAGAAAVSVIPWWLSAAAVLFSVLTGLAAGYYPAKKAVEVPALEAIKHD